MYQQEIPKVARWALMLAEYDCQVIHRSSPKMKHVDALSRVYFIQEVSLIKSIKTAQNSDDQIKTIIQILSQGNSFDNYVI